MAGYRLAALQRLRPLSRLFPLPFLWRLSGQQLLAPVYHSVSDRPLPHLRHLYRVRSLQLFEKDLDTLLRHFQPLSATELLDILRDGEPPRKPSFFLSFDDGLREFHDLVAPLLFRKGVPAVNFLNPAFLDNRELMFRNKASLLIEHCRIHPRAAEAAQAWLDKQGRPPGILHGRLLNIRYAKRTLLDSLAEELGLSFEDFLRDARPYLSSEQVRSLMDQGFDFGAHSLDHPRYDEIPLEEQLRQTVKSMDRLQQQFDLPHRLFAFPFTDYGVSLEFFEAIYGETPVLQASFGAAGLKRDVTPYNLQRLPVEFFHWPLRDQLKAELLYFLLKIPFGKNVIRRDHL